MILLGSDEMPKQAKNRWIIALLLAILFPAAALHFSCVAVMGPGTWGSGLEEKIPELAPADSNPLIGRYATEFESRAPAELTPPEQLQSLAGRPFFTDHDEAAAAWAIATHGGRRWIDEQHLFLALGEPPEAREIAIPAGWIIESPSILRKSGKLVLAVDRWNSWSIPAMAKLGRYFRSLGDPELRPEHTIQLYDPDARDWSYFGPGHSLAVAPDHQRAAFLRSGALSAGYYSLHIWDIESGSLTTVLSLRDVDEGSGRSFEFRWSADSLALQITGSTGGFERRSPRDAIINLIYLITDGRVYQVLNDTNFR